jgi:hypothetical protein
VLAGWPGIDESCTPDGASRPLRIMVLRSLSAVILLAGGRGGSCGGGLRNGRGTGVRLRITARVLLRIAGAAS